jgi:hypothetical protein
VRGELEGRVGIKGNNRLSFRRKRSAFADESGSDSGGSGTSLEAAGRGAEETGQGNGRPKYGLRNRSYRENHFI